MVRECSTCSLNDKQSPKAPLKQWNPPDQPWDRIHVDFMGKFLGYYFLIVVDAFSKWLEVFLMNSITTSATIHHLQELFARYGLCREIVSDNGSQFTSEEFELFCARNGIRHWRTAPGHPQSNGQAERYVQTVKIALQKGFTEGKKVSDLLQKFLFTYRRTTHSSTNSSPAELFLKRELRTVLDLLHPNTNDMSEQARARYQRNFDRRTKPNHYQVGDKVIVRDFRQNPRKVQWIPGSLNSPIGSRLWSVQVGNQVWRRHQNQIKHRAWSTDDDVTHSNLSSSTDELDVTSPDLLSDSSSDSTSSPTSPAPPTVPPQTLRRSSRIRKPVNRLITEI